MRFPKDYAKDVSVQQAKGNEEVYVFCKKSADVSQEYMIMYMYIISFIVRYTIIVVWCKRVLVTIYSWLDKNSHF